MIWLEEKANFIKSMVRFCEGHSGIHSAWIRIDHNHKDVTTFTVTKKWDFHCGSFG